MITGAEMAVVDANAAALGVSRKQLMESSGNAVARAVRAVTDRDDELTIVVGRGNNGGDAAVAARFLERFDPEVLLLGRAQTISTDIARENWAALVESTIRTRELRDSTAIDLEGADVVVDGMLGTGISGRLRDPERTAAAEMNRSSATVVSVDVPSGMDAGTGTLPEGAVRPDRVVTFHEAKPGLRDLDADCRVADIGIPEAAHEFTGPGDLLRMSREPDSHKGDNGEVLVVGGGPYTGAPALSALAALRAGADLVRVACPSTVSREIQGYAEDLIVRPVDGDRLGPEHATRILDLAAEHDAVVVGPGAGDADPTAEVFSTLLADVAGPAVVDADALRVVPEVETSADLVCTPHQGELVGMGGPAGEDWRERREAVTEFAGEIGVTLLVKGRYDVISDGSTTRVNRTGTPGMTVGGTGDVLAGVTGAFLTGQTPVDAAALGAFVTGRAGELADDDRAAGLVASDLPAVVPSAMSGPK